MERSFSFKDSSELLLWVGEEGEGEGEGGEDGGEEGGVGVVCGGVGWGFVGRVEAAEGEEGGEFIEGVGGLVVAGWDGSGEGWGFV